MCVCPARAEARSDSLAADGDRRRVSRLSLLQRRAEPGGTSRRPGLRGLPCTARETLAALSRRALWPVISAKVETAPLAAQHDRSTTFHATAEIAALPQSEERHATPLLPSPVERLD